MTTTRAYRPLIRHLLELRGRDRDPPQKPDRGALAALRRGLGKPPGLAPETWPQVEPFIGQIRPKRYDDACYLVAALFAIVRATGPGAQQPGCFLPPPGRQEEEGVGRGRRKGHRAALPGAAELGPGRAASPPAPGRLAAQSWRDTSGLGPTPGRHPALGQLATHHRRSSPFLHIRLH